MIKIDLFMQTYSYVNATQNNTMECPICFQEIGTREITYVTSCNHKFCKTCIKRLCLDTTLTFRCPICRCNCTELRETLTNVSTEVLYEIYSDIITSEESRNLIVSQDLYYMIGFVLITKNRGKDLLNYLLNKSDDAEFQSMYKKATIEKRRYYENLKDPISTFALELLNQKYRKMVL